MNETGMPTFPTSQYSFGIPSQISKTRGRNKRDLTREGRSQTTLLADDMILYLKAHENLSKIY
jgi:hypothetical protein